MNSLQFVKLSDSLWNLRANLYACPWRRLDDQLRHQMGFRMLSQFNHQSYQQLRVQVEEGLKLQLELALLLKVSYE